MPEKCKKKVETLLQVCKTPIDFIAQFNPDFCSERYDYLNNETLALQSKMIKLSELQYAYLPDTAIDLIRAWLTNVSIYCRLETDTQVVKEIARELYKEIFMLNLAEFTLFFSRLKRGYYGVLYGRFDGMMIASAAREYRQQRGVILSKLSEEEQNQIV